MPKPEHHIVVCTNTRPPGRPKGSCGERGAQPVVMKFVEELEKRGLFGKVVLSGSTCVGMCSAGTIVIVYPDAVWYQGVKPEDVNDILDQHIQNGKPVDTLVIPDST